MNLQSFFDNFELLAEAPNGVQKLRELILQLAVMGKLAPQHLSDEPASVLLEQIRFKKELVYQERKLKKEKLQPIKLDNTPFEIPLTWQWCRLEEITEKLGAGSTPKGGKNVYKETGIKFIRSQNVWNNGLYLKNIAYIPLSIHQRMNGTIVQPGDILLNITGASIGRSCVVSNDFDEGNVSQHVAIVRLVDKSIRYYLHLCLISPYIQNCIMGVQVGISREGLSMTNLKDFLIPLPPHNEIIRIANKVDQLMKLCDELEARQQKKREARVTINNTAIAQLLTAREPEEFNKSWQRIYNYFDLLYSTPENISKLRSCILQLAVMGKLGPQDPHDENASILLKKIKAEKEQLAKEGKIRKEKPLPDIEAYELKHDIPREWEWSRLIDICELITDGTHQTPKYTEHGRIFLSAQNVKPFRFTPKIHKFVSEEDYQGYVKNRKPEFEDILLTRVGAGIGEAAVIDQELDFAFYVSIALIRPLKNFINPYYLTIWLNSPSGTYNSSINTYGKGVSQGNLNLGLIKKFVIPVPPLNEQCRIIAKVNQLMKLCDQLESQLKQSVAESEKLMETAVRQLLDVNTIVADDISVQPTKLETKTVKQSRNKTQSYHGEAVQLNLPLF